MADLAGAVGAPPSEQKVKSKPKSAAALAAEEEAAAVQRALAQPIISEVQVYVDEKDDTMLQRTAYKRGQLLHLTNPRDIISSFHFDGELLFFGTFGGKVYSWDFDTASDTGNPKGALDVVDIQRQMKPARHDDEKEVEEEIKDDVLLSADSNTTPLELVAGAAPLTSTSTNVGTTPLATSSTDSENKDKDKSRRKLELQITCFDLSSGTVAAGFDNGAVALYNFQSGTAWFPPGQHKQSDPHLNFYHAERVSGVRFSENGRLFTTGHDGNFLVRDLNHNKIEACYRTCACPISDMVVQDENLVLLSSWDGCIRHIDLRMRGLVHQFRPNNVSPVRSLLYVPETLYCSHGCGEMKSWDLRTRAVVTESFAGHSGVVNQMAVRDNHLFSASDDETVRVFDIHTGVCLEALTGHTDAVSSLQIIADTLVTGSYDGSLRIYDLSHIDTEIEHRRKRMEDGCRLAQELYAKNREEIARARKKNRKKKGKKKR